MDRIVDTPIFLEFYGGLLTERQTEIIAMYCDDDYSLSEIAESLQISRQAVHDSLKGGIAALEGFEEKMGFVKKYRMREKIVGDIIGVLNGPEFSRASSEANEGITIIKKKLAELSDI